MCRDCNLSDYACPSWQDFPDIELYMDQVVCVLEKILAPFSEEDKAVTPTMINNYVKQKILPPPVNKKYTREHLAHLFMICTLKRFMQLSEICNLLENLEKSRSPEEAYGIFRQELERALHLIFGGKTFDDTDPAEAPVRVLRSACMAFGAILFSRQAYLEADAGWQEEKKRALEETALREKREKEEKEEKEKKAKEKKK